MKEFPKRLIAIALPVVLATAVATVAVTLLDSRDREIALLTGDAYQPGFQTILFALGGALFVVMITRLLIVLELQRERLRQLAARERDLVALVSHQLRLPLTHLSWSLDASFGDGGLSPEQAAAVKEMQATVRSSVKLVADLLDVSRLERGVIKMESEKVPLTVMTEEALTPLRETAKAKGVELDVDAPAGLHARADKTKAIEALRNVIDNAVKFAPTGTKVSLRAGRDDNETVWVQVRDEGSGLSIAAKARIFKKSSVFAEQGSGGAGLGLYLAQEFVERMGGSIRFETSTKGTSFFLRFPSWKDS